MSTVVALLEHVGQTAELKNREESELRAELSTAGVEENVLDALFRGDRFTLAAHLKLTNPICCGLFKPEPDEEDEEEEPSKEDEVRAHRAA